MSARNPLSLIFAPIVDSGVHVGTPLELSWKLLASASQGMDEDALNMIAANFTVDQLLVEVAALERLQPALRILHNILVVRAQDELLRMMGSGMSEAEMVKNLTTAAIKFDQQAGW